MASLPTLASIRQSISQLEDRHRRNGVALSGRILHVCHSLPVTCTFTPNLSGNGPGSWSLGPRYGHSAMISGILSLSATHEQLIVGWTGDIEGGNDITDADRKALDELLLKPNSSSEDAGDSNSSAGYISVHMSSPVAHSYYDGYCKQILWPLFHYLLWQDVATEYASADSHYPFYEQANLAFAQRIAEVWKPGDLIWVHDYHLLLLPSLLREVLGAQGLGDPTIGLFVHTPFPSSEVFRCLPRRKEILDGMLGANLVCFQNYSYSRHFVSTCIRVCGYESHANGRGIENPNGGGHLTSVAYCPVGIDAVRVAKDVLRPGIKPKFDALRTLYAGKKIIVGRDKLDVVKGVLQKLRAFEKMLVMYPEWVGRVVMIQVTSPSLSDSPKLERQVSELVAHINGTYGSLDFIPCHHYHQTLKKDEFYALLSVADLAVITPLRDGMNTTSMEFVIAQERTKRSPSVLSELMGVMGILGPGVGDGGEYSESEDNKDPTSPGGLSASSSSINGLNGLAGFRLSSPKHKSPGWDSTSSSAIPTPNLVVRGDPIVFGTGLASASLSLSSPATLTEDVKPNGTNGINGIKPIEANGSSDEAEVGSEDQGALWVNPWDLSAVATAMHRALLMPEAEKVVRHRYLYDVVTTRTSHMWATVLVEMLLSGITSNASNSLTSVNGTISRKGTPYLNIGSLKKWYEAASVVSVPSPLSEIIKPTRLFFFDYDGTLAPIVKVPSAAVPSSETLRALERLAKDKRNLVYIISGRDGAFLDEHLGSVGTSDGGRGLGFSAEHGGFVKEPRKEGEQDAAPEWRNFTSNLDMSWMSEVYEVFRYYTERTTGSEIELKKSSITWHYRGADPEWGQFQCRQCQDLLENNLANKRPIEVLVGKKNLEVRPLAVNKGEIVKRLVYKNPQVEFIFCAGDDKTDEDMFRALRQFTERPSTDNTTAQSTSEPKVEFVMEAPLSVTLIDDDASDSSTTSTARYPAATLRFAPEAVFTVAVGHSSKRTLASWHVTSPAEVVGAMEGLVGLLDGEKGVEKPVEQELEA